MTDNTIACLPLVFNPINDIYCPYTETSQLILTTYQPAGFYMTGTLVANSLIVN